MKKLAIYGQQIDRKQYPYLKVLLSEAEALGFELSFYRPFSEMIAKQLPECMPTFIDLSFRPDFLLTLGGDGTILNAARLVRDSGIPIMGINLGRLGFLANVEKKIISEALSQLNDGNYSLEERSLLQLDANEPLFEDFPYALNDMTLVKRDTSSMIVIHTYLDGEFLNSYWADGVILATPTGSTGYNLSCSGPILMPTSSNFILTPIAPHNLNVRPLVLPDRSKIEFTIEGRTENFLCTLDSRYETVTNATRLTLSKAPFCISMVKLKEVTFLGTMREKLMWGRDTRNFK
ncbi:MAG TPA: NAD kinase [Saprospiraceae bacterium]|nr:NAD kinase [Saprospiraceae bacterium]HQW55558.1 NAD kinase [Saprospiraceae bacterium]